MLTRSLNTTSIRRMYRAAAQSVRMFSTEAQATEQAKPDIEKEFDNISEEDKKKYREAWGLKFNDECIKFEKEWEQIAMDRDHAQMEALKEELSETSQKKVQFLSDKIISLNMMELRYLATSMKQRIQKTSGMNLMKLNMDWPSMKMDTDGTWPPLNPNWFKQQELMSQISPFIGVGGGGGGGAATANQGSADEEPKEEVKKEEVKEKTNFDVELSGFDAKNKIKLIKELRGILGLGLKEAKEMVESAPVWVKKGMPKAEVDDMVSKLQELGAELKIV